MECKENKRINSYKHEAYQKKDARAYFSIDDFRLCSNWLVNFTLRAIVKAGTNAVSTNPTNTILTKIQSIEAVRS
jgi:hypothetical protein